MTTKDQLRTDLQIRTDNSSSQHHCSWLRGIRRSNVGAIGQNPSTQYQVQIQTYPAASNIARGIIYPIIGVDLIYADRTGTKSLIVQGIEYVFQQLAPAAYPRWKSAADNIPYVYEGMGILGAFILVDGALRLISGLYNAHRNSELM